jgi:hypothetical protein
VGFGRGRVGKPGKPSLLAFFFILLCFVNCRLNRANVAEISPVLGSGLIPIAGFRQPTEALGARQIQFSLDFEF